MRIHDSNPLNYIRGVSPQQESFTPAPEPEIPWELNTRITKHTRAALGQAWTPRHDRLTRKYLQMVREGKPLPQISPQSAGVPWTADTQLPSTCFPDGFSQRS